MDAGQIGKRDIYCAGLSIAFWLAMVATAFLFLATVWVVLMAEETQTLRLWPLVASGAGTLLCLALAWGLQGRILRECGRQT